MNATYQPTTAVIKVFLKSSVHWPSVNETLFLFALTAAGLIGNYLNIELFFGVNFLFGSAATMIAVRASGTFWGTFVGIIIGSYSSVLWGHHYAIIIFGLEAFFVGFVSFYLKKDNLVLIDVGFWLFLGMPVGWCLYVYQLEVPEATANLIALKQMVNGITNVILASLLIQFTPIMRWKNLKEPLKTSKKLPISSMIHTVLSAFIVVPMLTIIIISGQTELEETHQDLKDRVAIKTLQASRELTSALDFYAKALGAISVFELSQSKPEKEREHLKKTLDNLNSSLISGLLNTEIIDADGQILFSYPRPGNGISLFANRTSYAVNKLYYLSDFDVDINSEEMSFTMIMPTFTDKFLAATFSKAIFTSLIATIADDDELVAINDAQGSIVISNNEKDLSKFVQGENPQHLLPSNTQLPTMLRWRQAYWKNTTSFMNNHGWTVRVASPMKESMEFLEAEYTYKMASMIIICLGSLLLVPAVLRLLSAPLIGLTVAADMLTNSIERDDIVWPTSNINEIDSLVHQFMKFIQAIKEQNIALYRSEEKYSQIVETASDGIISMDDSQKIILFNSGAETIFGFNPNEIIGQSITRVIPSFFQSDEEDFIDKLSERTQNTPEVNMPTSLLGIRKSGEEFAISVTVSKALNANEKIFTLIFQDITEREAMSLRTVNIANELTELIDTANAPIFGIDAQGNITEWNQQAEKITGFDNAEVMGRDLVANFITDDYKASVGLVLANALKGDETANYEFPLYTKAGDRIDILLNSTTRRDASGQIRGVVGVGQDITELNKVRIEQANIANELTQLIDTANAPIFGIDAQGNITEWNQQAEKITGFDNVEVMGRDLVANFITDDYKASVGLVLANALKGDETANYEFPLYTKAGDRIDILLNSTTRRDASGNIVGVVGVGQDITELNKVRDEQERERKQAAAQIIQASKLATLGEMATSVAHELNQPLNVIRMASANSRRMIAKDDIDPEYLNAKFNRIEEQTARAAAIIDHMRMFGREAKESAVLVDPCKVVSQALDLIGEQLRLSGIEVVTELDNRCPPILGHPIQMEQVILNLLTNARDAIAQHDGESKITIRVFEDNKGVNIIAEDTGGGIAKDALSRVFEPFFTTKEVGKGTGLGLSVSYGIVNEANGTIVAENIAGGTRFTINIPIIV